MIFNQLGDTSVNGIDINPFFQFGVVGAIAALGLIFFYRAYKRETDRADKNEAELARLNSAIQDRFIPALTESTAALRETTELLRLWRSPPSPPHRRSG